MHQNCLLTPHVILKEYPEIQTSAITFLDKRNYPLEIHNNQPQRSLRHVSSKRDRRRPSLAIAAVTIAQLVL